MNIFHLKKLWQVTDEAGNPLHFTMQDGTRLAITSIDGKTLQVNRLFTYFFKVKNINYEIKNIFFFISFFSNKNVSCRCHKIIAVSNGGIILFL